MYSIPNLTGRLLHHIVASILADCIDRMTPHCDDKPDELYMIQGHNPKHVQGTLISRCVRNHIGRTPGGSVQPYFRQHFRPVRYYRYAVLALLSGGVSSRVFGITPLRITDRYGDDWDRVLSAEIKANRIRFRHDEMETSPQCG